MSLSFLSSPTPTHPSAYPFSPILLPEQEEFNYSKEMSSSRHPAKQLQNIICCLMNNHPYLSLHWAWHIRRFVPGLQLYAIQVRVTMRHFYAR